MKNNNLNTYLNFVFMFVKNMFYGLLGAKNNFINHF